MGMGMGLSDAELRITVLAAFSLALPYAHFAPLFGRFVKCRGGGRPRQWLFSAWAADLKINWAWAGATLSLAPQ